MSEMRSHASLRFKFKKSYESADELLKELRGILGEPEVIDYESEWNGEAFVDTAVVENFQYKEVAGNYIVVRNYTSGEFFLDYLLTTPCDSCDDINISLDFDELQKIMEMTLCKFPDLVEEKCMIKIFEWYNGCDMPVDF